MFLMVTDIFEREMFTPMSEEDAKKFEDELMPQNSATNANDIDINSAVKLVSQNFDSLFE